MRYTRLVEWVDTDYARLAHYQRFLDWIDEAFQRWCLSHGLSFKRLLDSGTGLPLVHVEVDYLKPVTLEERVTVEVELAEVSRAGVTTRFAIYRGDGELAARGLQRRRFVSQLDLRGAAAPEEPFQALLAMQAENESEPPESGDRA